MTLDIRKTVISQYANSAVLLEVLSDFQQCVDPAADLDQFYDLIWNIQTAQGFGLDVLGKIVGVGRVAQVPDTANYFGFQEATVSPDFALDPHIQGFNQEPFYSGQPVTVGDSLIDAVYRTVIMAKAMANISDGSIASINQILMFLFAGLGNVYVVDNLDMTITYKFAFASPAVTAEEFANALRVIPRSTGVAVRIAQP